MRHLTCVMTTSVYGWSWNTMLGYAPPQERANPWAVFWTRKLLISTCNCTSKSLHTSLFFLHLTSLVVQMSVGSAVVQAPLPLLVVAPPPAPVLAPPGVSLLVPQVVFQDLDPHLLWGWWLSPLPDPGRSVAPWLASSMSWSLVLCAHARVGVDVVPMPRPSEVLS